MAAANLAKVNEFSTAKAFYVLCCDFLPSQMEGASMLIQSGRHDYGRTLLVKLMETFTVSGIFIEILSLDRSTSLHTFLQIAMVILLFLKSDFDNSILNLYVNKDSIMFCYLLWCLIRKKCFRFNIMKHLNILFLKMSILTIFGFWFQI